MSLTIRNAVKADCPRLLELIKELALFEKAPEEVTVSMEEFEDSGFGENPVWWAFVGEYEGEIIGMSLYYIRYSTWKGRRLYLEDIIITESMRGKGFGKDLLDHTIAYAKEQGYSGMMWQVLDWNTPAIDFYKKYNSKFDEEWINVNINF
ncbi:MULTISPECIES: GNAT family N-acetyltransferase [Sphingobacterium]|uniref:GNAT family N-acetyltransferase n=1 Tax=Sphingobacterium TaxID=28453 RepID=UPI001625499A|nr:MULTISPECIES: GNAT family N-acetyltransferase [Sphingobacterium]MBV2225345.1 GNAT family N-acetyltransferase [Sphingobacterium mizutaii]